MSTKMKSNPRRLGLREKVEDVGTKLRRMIVSVYMANKEMNAAQNDYKKKRKELLGFMKENKIQKEVVENAEVNGKVLSMQAELEAPVSEKADVLKLYNLIGHETFMRIAKVTKGDVVEAAGNAVWEQVKTVHTGDENVTVGDLQV